MSGQTPSQGLSCPVIVGFFSTISHAHAETVLRGIAYCRFRFDVRLGLVSAISEYGQEESRRKANNKWL
jgi:hypothetical protein